MSAPRSLTSASELQCVLNDLGMKHGQLTSVLRAASQIDSQTDQDFNDLKYLIDVALMLAESAQEKSQSGEGLAGDIRQRLEGNPVSGDRLQGEVILQMLEAIARGGEGFSAFRLAGLASIVGALAKHNHDLKPVFKMWIDWMESLGIQTAIDKSVERATGGFTVGVMHAPGGADAVIGVTATAS